jgi:hypothetical protein
MDMIPCNDSWKDVFQHGKDSKETNVAICLKKR